MAAVTSTIVMPISVMPTNVLFTQNQWQINTTVVCVATTENNTGTWIVTAQTPFHPVSHIWPDHPADRGDLIYQTKHYSVADCVVGAIEIATQQLYIASDIPVKRDTEGWGFVVAHYIALPLVIAVGAEVTLVVDKGYQQGLSRGHSGGHLSSLALNKVLHSDFWRKDPSRRDELGNYDFHSYAQEKSLVSENCSIDHYRLGKTLRKRGLNSAEMVANLAEITLRMNQQLAQWLQLATPIVMRREGDTLTDSRYWQCDLGPEGVIEIPCGGTHATSLAEYRALTIEFEIISDQELVMITTAIVA
ncbi:alanyl-tRNA editing protein [Photobacterium phosphoreum]|uniref:alanyl-tRNA editing protein n=1 Tax=Photobacterium phosphoreum TaxID=659 RepID=UPI001EFD0CFA|nr:alanyl-tRNA editing protein [Photobacterium phosphoreum]